jgi:hypothetical protein
LRGRTRRHRTRLQGQDWDELAVRLGALNSRLGALVTQKDAEIAGKARVQLYIAEVQQLLDATLRKLVDTQ